MFSYYDEHDYFLGNITELQPALLDTCVEIAHKNLHDFDHQKFFTPEFNADPDAMSFIGGSPVYLQHTLPDGLDDYVFVGKSPVQICPVPLMICSTSPKTWGISS